jgi:hypothetical protein
MQTSTRDAWNDSSTSILVSNKQSKQHETLVLVRISSPPSQFTLIESAILCRIMFAKTFAGVAQLDDFTLIVALLKQISAQQEEDFSLYMIAPDTHLHILQQETTRNIDLRNYPKIDVSNSLSSYFITESDEYGQYLAYKRNKRVLSVLSEVGQEFECICYLYPKKPWAFYCSSEPAADEIRNRCKEMCNDLVARPLYDLPKWYISTFLMQSSVTISQSTDAYCYIVGLPNDVDQLISYIQLIRTWARSSLTFEQQIVVYALSGKSFDKLWRRGDVTIAITREYTGYMVPAFQVTIQKALELRQIGTYTISDYPLLHLIQMMTLRKKSKQDVVVICEAEIRKTLEDEQNVLCYLSVDDFFESSVINMRKFLMNNIIYSDINIT